MKLKPEGTTRERLRRRHIATYVPGVVGFCDACSAAVFENNDEVCPGCGVALRSGIIPRYTVEDLRVKFEVNGKEYETTNEEWKHIVVGGQSVIYKYVGDGSFHRLSIHEAVAHGVVIPRKTPEAATEYRLVEKHMLDKKEAVDTISVRTTPVKREPPKPKPSAPTDLAGAISAEMRALITPKVSAAKSSTWEAKERMRAAYVANLKQQKKSNPKATRRA